MNYDRMRFLKLTQELEALNKREGEITSELAKMFGGSAIVDPLGPIKGKVAGVAGKKAPAPEPLQSIVLKAMETLRKPKSALDIADRIRGKRPQTTNAAVGSVLAQLSKRGKIVRTDDALFFMPADTAALASTPVAPNGGAVANGAKNGATANANSTANAGQPAPPEPSKEVLEDA